MDGVVVPACRFLCALLQYSTVHYTELPMVVQLQLGTVTVAVIVQLQIVCCSKPFVRSTAAWSHGTYRSNCCVASAMCHDDLRIAVIGLLAHCVCPSKVSMSL
eukprot:GHRR01031566.1.p2 GENE.GHRR01031566.1~~GHRR01031566.1.p2  ORF type:complete len:103 (-),score=15.36 GHRR01031566.1:627-935(-)